MVGGSVGLLMVRSFEKGTKDKNVSFPFCYCIMIGMSGTYMHFF
jgi:hypothetical protein